MPADCSQCMITRDACCSVEHGLNLGSKAQAASKQLLSRLCTACNGGKGRLVRLQICYATYKTFGLRSYGDLVGLEAMKTGVVGLWGNMPDASEHPVTKT